MHVVLERNSGYMKKVLKTPSWNFLKILDKGIHF